MSFGYDAAWALSTSVADIDDAATSLITRLIGERQELGGQGRPIIFLAHSLGGIVVKRVS
jgi:alpha-beta hydrolase superfamily lysophospholipase